MPRRDDLEKILVIGSGPIVIGQACEFDYSGTQACRVLRQDGYSVVLINPNPATIMTDPDFAQATYLEPLETEIVAAIIKKERPDALLATLGGQSALNCAMRLVEAKVLDEFEVEMIGANALAIATAENRELFKAAMVEIGLKVVEGTSLALISPSYNQARARTRDSREEPIDPRSSSDPVSSMLSKTISIESSINSGKASSSPCWLMAGLSLSSSEPPVMLRTIYARVMYSADLVSTLIRSPWFTKRGTCIVIPVSRVAGFLAPETRSP